MIVNWKQAKIEQPNTIRFIEIETGFKYDPPYATFTRSEKPITYLEIEALFDKLGWFLTIYPTDYPHWNGVISNRSGEQLFNDPSVFEGVSEREHAKSVLVGIGVRLLDQQLKEFSKDIDYSEDETFETYESDLDEVKDPTIKGKALEEIVFDDLKDQVRLNSGAFPFVIFRSGNKAIVLRNNKPIYPKNKQTYELRN